MMVTQERIFRKFKKFSVDALAVACSNFAPQVPGIGMPEHMGLQWNHEKPDEARQARKYKIQETSHMELGSFAQVRKFQETSHMSGSDIRTDTKKADVFSRLSQSGLF